MTVVPFGYGCCAASPPNATTTRVRDPTAGLSSRKAIRYDRPAEILHEPLEGGLVRTRGGGEDGDDLLSAGGGVQRIKRSEDRREDVVASGS